MTKVHTILLVVCSAALLACVALSVPLLTTTGPESRDVAPAAAGPSPAPETTATRRDGLPHCLIGSWRVVSQEETIKFYIDTDPLPFTFGGGDRTYEFHPDGQVVERNDGFTMVSHHGGQKIRTVRNGERIFTWSATARTVTYHSLVTTSLVVDFYDARGRLSPATETTNRNFDETDDITCAPTRIVEHTDGYQSTWERTSDYGVYG